ncbi:hypothetical protein QYF36_019180 [Acer negundo]|nr:hypothetical protein QYF36_019180 [Acer negundo]
MEGKPCVELHWNVGAIKGLLRRLSNRVCTIILSTMETTPIELKVQKETFIKAYTPVIYGINGSSMWSKTNGIPMQCPDFKKQRGGPKKKRNLQSVEVRIGNTSKLTRNYIIVRCGKCALDRHNRATCDKRVGSNGPRIESVAGTESVAR